MMDIAEKFQKIGVVPVVVLEDAKDAVPLAQALVEGGLPCAEVTFRTAAAEESIRLMAENRKVFFSGEGAFEPAVWNCRDRRAKEGTVCACQKKLHSDRSDALHFRIIAPLWNGSGRSL